jgi:selenocysteine-specific elongation factor
MIFATAGHVDHGKTTLIKALTGKNTDTLAEEQRRGMSIDLGFAWRHDPQFGSIGFVDVPGHARFIRTMLAGIAGVDAVLLVVAADEGPMPQTREHLALLDLLGVNRGIVVMSAIDRANAEQRAACHVAIHAMLKHSKLANSPVLEVAANRGDGITELLSAIHLVSSSTPARSTEGYPRFLIDRRFTVPGSGCVVTGTLINGLLATNQHPAFELCITPQAKAIRLRAIQVDGRPVAELRAGQRAALNIAGDLNIDHPQRGDWLIGCADFQLSNRLDIRISLLPDVKVHRGTLQILSGASACSGRLVWLDEAAGLAQIMLDQSMHSLVGDPIIVRDPATNRTIGGGTVIDPQGRQRGRSKPAALARLRDLSKTVCVSAALKIELMHQPEVNLPQFARCWNLRKDETHALLKKHELTLLGQSAVNNIRMAEIEQQILESVRMTHQFHPELRGLHQHQLLNKIGNGLSISTKMYLIKRLVTAGQLQRHGSILALPGHQPVLSLSDQMLWLRVYDELIDTGLLPPIVGDLAEHLGLEREVMLQFMQRMQHCGYVLAIAPNRFYLPERLDELAAIARELCRASPDGCFSAADYRDRSGLGRNLTIKVLEYLDRTGITRYRHQRRSLQTAYQQLPEQEIG